MIKTNMKKESKEDSLETENRNLIIQNEKLNRKVEKYMKGYNDLKEKYKGLKIKFQYGFIKVC